MTNDIPWLNDDEQHMWRQWMGLHAELLATLNREMQADTGLSNPDYQVLVVLTDSAEGRIRVSDLAASLQWERSRVSHHVARMEKRDLVSRRGCPDDGRGAFVRITETGRAAIERAAPAHVRAVRDLVFDALTADEVAQLGAIFDRLRSRIGPSAG
ncbi:MarR family winged helix-turn-helix transcriptional regulator [Streptomyces lancefieldiae]|uniref:MarR family winged helix-turn-helix transcriptional regulator n=1 Tax=Streptomyces lancefieldiae TaxID=3075520 RepID=A0ABU3AGX0_9ACTN|nr:MarR family winged helix-turn-helix transcriptional regulator [Streptomyces sp. DSM 40712]MDT0609020.1 MarR family winged helix-turn-helix transcriptional regulator [Streptomyces sp. DSM 40712]